jgi:hypothetical protein
MAGTLAALLDRGQLQKNISCARSDGPRPLLAGPRYRYDLRHFFAGTQDSTTDCRRASNSTLM